MYMDNSRAPLDVRRGCGALSGAAGLKTESHPLSTPRAKACGLVSISGLFLV
jgi:hypothetical protein